MRLKDTGLTSQDIKDKVNKYMIETYERFDFLAERAKDMYMYDENGEEYLDFYAGIAVNNAGSCNEKVVAAVKDQVGDIMHTFNYPYTIPQALLAEKVCETIGMDKIFYQNSGTEANEAMIKMARKYGIEKYGPNHYHIVTAKMGFHGRTFGAMSATGQPGNGCQVGFGPMTYGFSYAPYNSLQAFKDACTENTIAIMIEPVQGEGGVHPATQEFMKGLREFCDENDMLLLIDEVQTGWCRTGAVMSYMNYGIKPDIVSMAKGLGGGMPIGAICATAEVAKAFTPGSHGTTFGGHPVSCAFGAMSATGQPGNGCQVGFGPMTYGFSYAPYNSLQAFKDACTENTIAIMIEPVQGEGGVHPATQEFMKGLREFCDENDMLLLIDEVQTGWCRTGAVMSYMNYGIKPDIVSMAKGLGGGMPIGAICATAEVAKAFTPGSHGTTFGGHPVSCAAALAEVNELIDRDLAGNAKKVGDYFAEKLKGLPHVKEVRHQGLLTGIEFDDTLNAVDIKHACFDRKLLVTAIGSSVIRTIPPLIVTEEECDKAFAIMKEAVESLA